MWKGIFPNGLLHMDRGWCSNKQEGAKMELQHFLDVFESALVPDIREPIFPKCRSCGQPIVLPLRKNKRICRECYTSLQREEPTRTYAKVHGF
jgi:hypothetical protein